MDKVFKNTWDACEWLRKQGFKYNPDTKIWTKWKPFSKPLIVKEHLLLALDHYDMWLEHVVIVEIGEGSVSKLHTDLFNKGLRTLNAEEYEKYEKDGRSYKDQPVNVLVKEEYQADIKVNKYFAIRYDMQNKCLILVDVTDSYNPSWSKEYYERLRRTWVPWGVASENFFKQLREDQWIWDSEPGWPENNGWGYEVFCGKYKGIPLILKRGNYTMELIRNSTVGHVHFTIKVNKIK